GQVVTVNVSSHGSIFEYMPGIGDDVKVLLVQEHHLLPERLQQAQSQARDIGWHGIWAAATPSTASATGTTAGVAILVRTDAMITAPILAEREVVTGRCLFAHIHWGVPGGFTAGSIYLDTKDGMGPVNTAYLWETVKAPARFNSEGVDWLIAGDWNNQPAELFSSSWATAASAIPFCPKATSFEEADDAEGLAACMDDLMIGVERELTNRYDHVGPAALRYSGRAGATSFTWRKVAWQPPLKRTYKRPQTLAWKVVLRWFMHIQKERHRLRTLVTRLQMAHVLCDIDPPQCAVLLQAFSEVGGYIRNIMRSQVVLHQMPENVQAFLNSGLQVLVAPGFEDLLRSVGNEATRLRKEDQRESYRAWMQFQRKAFQSGASIAHRVTKVRPLEQRIWGRARRGISRQWEQQHRTDNVWGNRSRYTSSDSAFSHNLDSEVAVLRGQFSATVLLDLTKAFDMARPSQLFREGCLLGYPPRMLYMLLKMHAQPRSLKGYGTFSDMVQVDQGILAGCTHAVCMLECLTLRAILRLRDNYAGVVPRALVDDVSVQYVGPDPKGILALDLAVRIFQEDSRVLGSCVNDKKSGLVAAT
ncbi:unnamed protein product, partial [Prorocentrum cordatum]